MSKFFINRPIVAMVISIVMVLVGSLTVLSLPVAQFPNITPPEIQVLATYVGADAQTLEQAVATPIEQQHELHVFAKCHGEQYHQPDRGF
jgi:hydrophobic/amphiphilic exporter-1 (mainly G- bacteria), HAE1 family